MGLHEAIRVQSFTTYGFPCYGLFVQEGCVISKGTCIWWCDPGKDSVRTYTKEQISNAPTQPMSFQQVLSITNQGTITSEKLPDILLPNPQGAMTTYSYMIEDDCFASTPYPEEDLSNYINHSCAPNIAYRGDQRLVALRDISTGEQIVYDYAFTETPDSLHYGMRCRCGAAQCRGFLDFLQYQDPAYIRQNYDHCSSFIQRKMIEHGWVHPDVVRRQVRWNTEDDDMEYGLFACQSIASGTPILTLAGKVVSGPFVSNLSFREQEMSWQMDDDLWQVPHPIHFHDSTKGAMRFETGNYINHSCQPNCGMLDSVRVVSIRDIAANEAVTMDYAMVNKTFRSVRCYCGSPSCRGIVTSDDYKSVGHRFFDYLSPFLKAKYMKALAREVEHKATMTTTSSSSSSHASSSIFSIEDSSSGNFSIPWTFSHTDDDDDDDHSDASTSSSTDLNEPK